MHIFGLALQGQHTQHDETCWIVYYSVFLNYCIPHLLCNTTSVLVILQSQVFSVNLQVFYLLQQYCLPLFSKYGFFDSKFHLVAITPRGRMNADYSLWCIDGYAPYIYLQMLVLNHICKQWSKHISCDWTRCKILEGSMLPEGLGQDMCLIIIMEG